MATGSSSETDDAEKIHVAGRTKFPLLSTGANCIEQGFARNIEMFATSTAYNEVPRLYMRSIREAPGNGTKCNRCQGRR